MLAYKDPLKIGDTHIFIRLKGFVFTWIDTGKLLIFDYLSNLSLISEIAPFDVLDNNLCFISGLGVEPNFGKG